MYSKGMANLKPFQFFGSRLFLCLTRQRDGLAVGVLDGGHVHGRDRLEPRPMEIASGMGDRKCEASCSLLIILSRISAQPAVLVSLHLQALLFVEAQRVRP